MIRCHRDNMFGAGLNQTAYCRLSFNMSGGIFNPQLLLRRNPLANSLYYEGPTVLPFPLK